MVIIKVNKETTTVTGLPSKVIFNGKEYKLDQGTITWDGPGTLEY